MSLATFLPNNPTENVSHQKSFFHSCLLQAPLSLQKMSPKKKNTFRKIFISNPACVCGCGRPKISRVHKAAPKSKKTSNHENSSASIENEDKGTTTTFSFRSDASPYYISESESTKDHHRKTSVSPRILSPCPKINESVAMVKESGNPYEDFRASMKQMIDERETYSEGDLKELLRCFLDLNSPNQHNVIVRAFVDICSDRSSH